MLDSGVVGEKGIIKTIMHTFSDQDNHGLYMVVTDGEDRVLNVIDEEVSLGDRPIIGEARKYTELIVGSLMGFLFTSVGVYLQEHVHDKRTRRATVATAQMRLVGAIRGLRDNWDSTEYDAKIEDEGQLYYAATYCRSPDRFLSVLESFKRIGALRRVGRATAQHRDQLAALEKECKGSLGKVL